MTSQVWQPSTLTGRLYAGVGCEVGYIEEVLGQEVAVSGPASEPLGVVALVP